MAADSLYIYVLYIYVYMCVYMYMYTHTHLHNIHTYIHTYILNGSVTTPVEASPKEARHTSIVVAVLAQAIVHTKVGCSQNFRVAVTRRFLSCRTLMHAAV